MRINLIGNFPELADGYGRHGRAVRHGLVERGVDVNSIYFREPDWIPLLDKRADFTIQLVWWNGLRKLPDDYRTLIFSMYETSCLQDKTVAILNEAAEHILVPCHWCKQTFEESGVVTPVSVNPEGIDPNELPLVNWSDRPDRPFTFLAYGDDRGWRKGFDVALQALYSAFGENNPAVRLLIKSRAGGMKMFEGGMLPDNCILWNEDVANVADIYSACDCLIFPSCGEGWGLPPRECAAMGIPVIVPAHSGLLDGINHYATLQLNKITTTESDMGGLWYRCDVDELAQNMREVYEHQSRSRLAAHVNASWLRTEQTWEIAHNQLFDFLKTL